MEGRRLKVTNVEGEARKRRVLRRGDRDKEDEERVSKYFDNDEPQQEQTNKRTKGTKALKEEEEAGPSSSTVSPVPVPVAAPENYMTVIENIKKMRVNNPAPVDTMGCERTMDDNAEPKVRRFQTLVSLMLSSQTKDGVTFAAMQRLKEHGLTPESMVEIAEEKLQALLKPVSFHNTKAKNIKKVGQILIDKYDGDIPNNIKELLTLPGVGPKMSYICMQVAWGINEGIGVDTHVHRISERLGWAKAKGKTHTPEDTRKQLESWLPKELWQEVNILLVGFGQTTCAPVKPKCNECLNNTICPFGRKMVRGSKAKGAVLNEEIF